MLINGFEGLLQPKGPFACAEGSFEQKIVKLAHGPIAKYLNSVPDQARKLAFRADWLPRICRDAVNELYPSHGWALGLFNCYRLAGERTFAEYIFRKSNYFKQPLTKVMPVIEHYLSGPDSLIFWEKRFDQWLRSAIHSWSYFLLKQAGTMFKPSPKELEATLTGIIARHISSRTLELPSLVEPEMMWRFLKAKEAETQNLRCKRIDVDTWLLEIWPIVTEYLWTYHDLQKATYQINGRDPDRFFKSPAQVRDRCKKVLNLKLSPKVSRGRPLEPKKSKKTDADIYYRPALFDLAKKIYPISPDVTAWFTGPFGNIG